MTLLIGVDAGTTVTKAVAVHADDPAGVVRACAARPTQVVWAGRRCEQDQVAVLASVLAVLGDIATALGSSAGDVAAVGITAQGDGLWPVRADGGPVRDAISWMDARADGIVSGWEAEGVAESLYRHTGSAPFPGCTPALLAWMQRHEPDTLRATYRAGQCKDMLFSVLTGEHATEPSSAVLFDHRLRSRATELLSHSGSGNWASLLSRIEPVAVADLLPSGAALVGLPSVPVVAGPYDVVASAIGAGVTGIGDGLLIVGTTLACEVARDGLPGEGEPVGLSLATADPASWYRLLPAMAGAVTVDWVLRLIGASHADLPALLAAARPGIRMLPFLSPSGERAPFRDSRARGRLDGLTVDTGPGDLIRAAMSGTAYAAKACFDLAGLTGSLSACGGGVRGPWAQVFADVLGQPVLRCDTAETGALGAAIGAARALSIPAPAPAPVVQVDPDPGEADSHVQGYHRYLTDVETARAGWAQVGAG